MSFWGMTAAAKVLRTRDYTAAGKDERESMRVQNAGRLLPIGTFIIHNPSGLRGVIKDHRRRSDGTPSGLPYVIEWENLAAALVKIGNAVGVENMALPEDVRKAKF